MDPKEVDDATINWLLKNCFLIVRMRKRNSIEHRLLNTDLSRLKQWQGCPVILHAESWACLNVHNGIPPGTLKSTELDVFRFRWMISQASEFIAQQALARWFHSAFSGVWCGKCEEAALRSLVQSTRFCWLTQISFVLSSIQYY